MPLPTAPPLERDQPSQDDPGNPLLAFVVVLAALVAMIALLVALSGDGSSGDVNIDDPVPADAR